MSKILNSIDMVSIGKIRLWISQYFDSLINEIDMDVERLINTDLYNIQEINDFNLIRQAYIDEIQRIKQSNMKYLDENKTQLREKFDSDLQNLNDSIKTELFQQFCFILKVDFLKLTKNFKFGYLVSTNKFFDDQKLRNIRGYLMVNFQNEHTIFYAALSDYLTLDESIICAIEIRNKIELLKPEKDQIIRYKIHDEPIKVNIHAAQNIKPALLDNYKISKLSLTINDILSLNNASLNDNHNLEELRIETHPEKDNFKSELNLDKFLKLKKLTINILSYNKEDKYITRNWLRQNAFKNLFELRELYLAGISCINLSINNLKNLKRLTISNSDLSNRKSKNYLLTFSLFQYFTSLLYKTESLDQTRNQVLDNMLNGIEKLTELHLSKCGLNFSDLISLRDLVNLETLDLSFNSIELNKSLAEKSLKPFKKFIKLKILILNNNKIGFVDEHLLEGLNELNVLNLDSNNLACIKDYAFVNLNKLETLFIQENYNDYINEFTFYGLTELKNFRLDITSNNFVKFNLRAFEFMPKLRYLQINADISSCVFNRENLKIGRNPLDGIKNLESINLTISRVELLQYFLINNSKSLIDVVIQTESKLNEDECVEFAKENFLKDLVNLKWVSFCDIHKIDLSSSSLFGNSTFIELTELSLKNCGICELGENVFDNMINLEILNLSDNNISFIEKIIFRNFLKLKTLDLSNNKIVLIQPNSFDNLTELVELDLSDNCLKKLDSDIFSKLCNLEKLKLINPGAMDITNHFDNLRSLKILNLSSIKNISNNSSIFKNIINLVLISFNDFSLNYVSNDIFYNLINLTVLLLSNCEIGKIQYDAFQDLVNLDELDLSSNNLTFFENINLESLKILRLLNLSENKFIKFDFSIIDKLPSLERLDFRGNKNVKVDENVISKYKAKIHFDDE